MYLEHIKVFLNLAETLNFSKTALNMHLSQSSVSQAISSIENELNMRLFIRDRKGVKITLAGSDLYNSLKPWLNDYYKSVQHAQNLEIKAQVNLTIGYSGTPYENTVLPVLIKEFNRKFPDIKVFLENYDHATLIEHLKKGNCNIIFTMPDIIRGIDGLDYFNLIDGHYCLVTPKNSYSDLKAPLALSALNQFNLVFLDHRWCPPTQDKLQHEILTNNKHVNLAYVNNIATAHAMVKAEAGLGIWADFVQSPDDYDLNCIRLDTDIDPQYGIATLKQAKNEATKIFIKWIQNTKLIQKNCID